MQGAFLMRALRVVSAGPGVTLQDAGRHGWLRYGVTAAGAMDPLAFATVNRALDRAPGSAVVEVSLGGMEVEAEGGALSLALAGGAFQIARDGTPLPPAIVLTLLPGERLSIRAGASGAWCYLAADGAFDVPPELGSLATHTRSGIGGLNGRGLTAGDILPVTGDAAPRLEPAILDAPWLDRPGEVIRVLAGPQDDYFDAANLARFLAGPWTIRARSDRMAFMLDGPRIEHAGGFNIVSDGIAFGAIQIPGEGLPIVLMADRQPTGGFPKIANVIGADLGRLAQSRPGATFRFAAVTREEALAARRAEAAALAGPVPRRAILRTDLTSEFLLGLNLVDGMMDADMRG
jgi:biotin-dependent carboxylase-like uncharacterized protein